MEDLLAKLQNEKGNPCLSIIVPTYRLSPQRELNQEILRQALAKANALIDSYNAEPTLLASVKKNLAELAAQIDYNHLTEGLGLFVSPSLSAPVKFPFNVQEKINLENTFDTRHLSYLIQLMEEFYVLSLSKNEIHLFKSQTDGLKEIRNEDFPLVFEDDHEYSKPAPALSYSPNMISGFERDKSVTNEKRQISYLKEADDKLSAYVRDGKYFIISGSEEVVSNFENINQHTKQQAGKIIGNYEHSLPALHKLVENEIQLFKKKRKEELIHTLHESIGKKRAALGLTEVWQDAWEGKGLTLAVEKGYSCRAFVLPEAKHKLHLSPPASEYLIINDAIDDVIEKVLEKKGKVVFVEENDLSDMGHIAMILRYP